jgi:hypothetical protein
VAGYLAKLTFASMGDVFGPAVAVRAWLGEAAKARPHRAASGAEAAGAWVTGCGGAQRERAMVAGERA